MANLINLNDTDPASASGYQLGKWQKAGTVSGTDPVSGQPYYDASVETPNTGGVLKKTANYTAVAGDCGQLVSFSSASAVAYTLPATPPVVAVSRWQVGVENIGAGALTISATTAAKLDEVTAGTLVLAQNTGCKLSTDGTDYFTERGSAQPGSLLTLKHDGTLNGSQTLLNAKSGTGINITDDGVGGLTWTVQNTSAPVIRGSTKQTVNGASLNVVLPAGTQAGDFALLFAGTGYNPSGTPSGWTLLYSQTGTTWNGFVASKTLTSGDISTGFVTVSAVGTDSSVDMNCEMVTFIGATGGVREGQYFGGGTPDQTLTTSSAVLSTDAAVYWNSSRKLTSPTITPASGSATTLQTETSTNTNAVLADQSMPGGAFAVHYNAGLSSTQVILAQVIVQGATIVGAGSVTSVGVTVPAWLAATVTNPTTTPVAAITAATGRPANKFLATPDGSAGAVSERSIVAADLPVMVGDSGSGGTKGAVPAAAAGDAAAGKFLKADGTFAVPSGGGGGSVTSAMGTRAGLPGTVPAAGSLYRTTDGPYEFVSDGSAWNAFVLGLPVTEPAVSGFTADTAGVGTGLSSASSTKGGIVCTAGAAGYVSVPGSTPWAAEALFSYNVKNVNFEAIWLYVQNGSNLSALMGWQWDSGVNSTAWVVKYQKLNAGGGFNSQTNFSAASLYGIVPNAGTIWMRIRDDGTNRYFEIAPLGKAGGWYTVFSVVRTDYVTPTRVGFAYGGSVGAHLLSWFVGTPS